MIQLINCPSESLTISRYSSSIYCEALAQADGLEGEDKGMSTVQRIRTRVGLLERSAMAASAFASLQLTRVSRPQLGSMSYLLC